VYFAKVLPLDKFAISRDEIAWEDLGARNSWLPPAEVDLQWSSFDNMTGALTPLAGQTSKRLPAIGSGYSCLTLKDRKRPTHTIDVFVRHVVGEAQIVGIDRHW
jgi:hypothetical protein